MKTYAIFGAAGRIGKVLCEGMANDGVTLILVDRDLEGLKEVQGLIGSNSPVFECDLCDEKDVQSLFSKLSQIESSIDGIVNLMYPRNENFGSFFEEVSLKDFQENVGLHLGSYFLVCQKYLELAKNQGHGKIVNFSSIYGSLAPRFWVYEDLPMTTPVEYAVSKAGLEQLTRYLARYCKGLNIQVNAVAPGGILDGQDPRFLENYSKYCNSKGMLDSNDIVEAVSFLLGSGSDFMQGQILTIDDGFSL